MDLGLSDRVYIVSGASTGLGLSCARVLADEGSLLVLHANDEEELALVAPSIGDPTRILLVPGDISDPGTETRLVAAANARFGRLDGAIISCGQAPTSTVLEAADGTWREAFESSLLGPLRLARSVGKAATAEGASMVLLLSSTVRTPVMDAGVANGLRPGLAMAAKALADELGPRGVRASTTCWPVTSTRPRRWSSRDPAIWRRRCWTRSRCAGRVCPTSSPGRRCSCSPPRPATSPGRR
jgi:3-oxoacyl-[acyl-carrier protein] reductase